MIYIYHGNLQNGSYFRDFWGQIEMTNLRRSNWEPKSIDIYEGLWIKMNKRKSRVKFSKCLTCKCLLIAMRHLPFSLSYVAMEVLNLLRNSSYFSLNYIRMKNEFSLIGWKSIDNSRCRYFREFFVKGFSPNRKEYCHKRKNFISNFSLNAHNIFCFKMDLWESGRTFLSVALSFLC